jgi:hypothetical protein
MSCSRAVQAEGCLQFLYIPNDCRSLYCCMFLHACCCRSAGRLVVLRSSFAARHRVWTGSQCCCIGGVCAWWHAIALHSVTQSETGCAYSQCLSWSNSGCAVSPPDVLIAVPTSSMFGPNLLISDAGGCKPSTVHGT